MGAMLDFSELRGRILDLNSALERPGPVLSIKIYFSGVKLKLLGSNFGFRKWGAKHQFGPPLLHLCVP